MGTGNRYIVYVLQSVEHPDKYYVGFTTDLKRRLRDHNTESQIYSKRYAPWRVATYTVFTDRETAAAFETYLKSHSGRAFLHKRLIP